MTSRPWTNASPPLSLNHVSRRFCSAPFGALALILAAIGIYGVIAQSVVDRTHEIGIRMALGAHAGDVLRSVIMGGTGNGLAGIGLRPHGNACRWHIFSPGLLYEVPALDLATFLGASLVLMAVVLAACYIPARRAAQLDPMVALALGVRI